jgi:hypothetical protein
MRRFQFTTKQSVRYKDYNLPWDWVCCSFVWRELLVLSQYLGYMSYPYSMYVNGVCSCMYLPLTYILRFRLWRANDDIPSMLTLLVGQLDGVLSFPRYKPPGFPNPAKWCHVSYNKLTLFYTKRVPFTQDMIYVCCYLRIYMGTGYS